jgi:ribosomal protein S18 acetylase RimI-like enzyme
MVPSLTTSFAQRPEISTAGFRTTVRPSDGDAVERLVRMSGVFSAAEIDIARELVQEHLERGPAVCGYYFLFADGPDGLLGYSCYGPVPGTNGRYELYWIAVHPELRRAHLGKQLQAASEQAVRAMGGRYMVAETSTRAEYEPAHRFYAAQGYTKLAEIPDWHDEGDGLAIFGKRL